MGNSALTQFSEIETKYHQPGIDYIVYKYNQRKALLHTKDEVQRVHDHAHLLENQDIEFLNQQTKKLEQAFHDAKTEAETQKKGSVQESEAKSKQTAEEFSGYKAELKKLTDLQAQIKQKHADLRNKVQDKVNHQINKVPNNSGLKELPQYDSKTDDQRKSIEDECLKKFPQRANEFNTVDIERELTWDHFKEEFSSVLNKEQVQKDGETARNHVKNNIVAKKSSIFC